MNAASVKKRVESSSAASATRRLVVGRGSFVGRAVCAVCVMGVGLEGSSAGGGAWMSLACVLGWAFRSQHDDRAERGVFGVHGCTLVLNAETRTTSRQRFIFESRTRYRFFCPRTCAVNRDRFIVGVVRQERGKGGEGRGWPHRELEPSIDLMDGFCYLVFPPSLYRGAVFFAEGNAMWCCACMHVTT